MRLRKILLIAGGVTCCLGLYVWAMDRHLRLVFPRRVVIAGFKGERNVSVVFRSPETGPFGLEITAVSDKAFGDGSPHLEVRWTVKKIDSNSIKALSGTNQFKMIRAGTNQFSLTAYRLGLDSSFNWEGDFSLTAEVVCDREITPDKIVLLWRRIDIPRAERRGRFSTNEFIGMKDAF